MRTALTRTVVLIVVLLVALSAALLLLRSRSVKASALQDGMNDVICVYSHTLPDDPIVYPNKPGIAMQHDFFGNAATNAYSTADSLLAQPATTCENAADATGYWAPSLKLPDGTVVKPTFQKTYYTNQPQPSNIRVPVQPFPRGLKMMAGDHHGTAPNPHVSFICSGMDYTNAIPTQCKPNPDKNNSTTLEIGVQFPSCWDGANLSPVMGGHNNLAYPDTNGVCPAGYPVQVPFVSLNVSYALGAMTDLSGVQLSLDPTLDANGNVVSQEWGSLYTAHGDVFVGWRDDSRQYIAEYCMNKGRNCDKDVAYSYFEPAADATVTGGTASNTNDGTATALTARQASGSTPESMIYVKFKIPQGAATLPSQYTPVYKMILDGANQTDSASTTINAYSVATSWDETTITAANAPACSGTGATMTVDSNVVRYRSFVVTTAINEAIAAGKDTVAFCIRGAGTRLYSFSSREGDNKPVLLMLAVNPLPY